MSEVSIEGVFFFNLGGIFWGEKEYAWFRSLGTDCTGAPSGIHMTGSGPPTPGFEMTPGTLRIEPFLLLLLFFFFCF